MHYLPDMTYKISDKLNEINSYFPSYNNTSSDFIPDNGYIKKENHFYNNTKINSSVAFDLSIYNNVQEGISFFILLLKEIMKMESKMQTLKEKISEKQDLEIKEIFRYFDRDCKGYFLLDEFKLGLENLEINLCYAEAKLLFKYIDRNNDDSISLNEFVDLIYPQNIMLSTNFLNRKPEKNKEISKQSKNLIIDFFRFLLENENRIQNIKILLTKKPGFNFFEIFEVLKGKIKGFIIKEDVIVIYNSFNYK